MRHDTATISERLESFTTFEEFPKISRWERDVIITEKIDGQNSHVAIVQISADEISPARDEIAPFEELVRDGYAVRVEMALGQGDDAKKVFRYLRAGSRTRWLAPGSKTDNFGFAQWVFDNAGQLAQLGPGKHHGEWWGSGIGRGYGQRPGERHFSLFNVSRFTPENVPACCKVVPVLYQGPLRMQAHGELATEFCLRRLDYAGSQAAPGFRNFEGIVIYHTAGNKLFKRTTGPEEERGKEHGA